MNNITPINKKDANHKTVLDFNTSTLKNNGIEHSDLCQALVATGDADRYIRMIEEMSGDAFTREIPEFSLTQLKSIKVAIKYAIDNSCKRLPDLTGSDSRGTKFGKDYLYPFMSSLGYPKKIIARNEGLIGYLFAYGPFAPKIFNGSVVQYMKNYRSYSETEAIQIDAPKPSEEEVRQLLENVEDGPSDDPILCYKELSDMRRRYTESAFENALKHL